jgi:4-diphosphocytidyl-2-C-methyl-D-erythritol kinase
MNRVSVQAPAKINLTLDVLARRRDGYHDIRSVMQTVSLCDSLLIIPTPETPGIRLDVIGPEAVGVPADATNIVYLVAVRMQHHAREHRAMPTSRSGLHITLTKNIPSQAGLGGGSSDAAAALNALDTLYALHFPPDRLTKIAAAVGADVPFFLSGGTALVEGLGERVTPLPPFDFNGWVVIVKPPVGVVTAQAYATLDAIANRVPGQATVAWEKFDISDGSFRLGNDFQTVILAGYPAVAAAFDAMISADGIPPLLCGSGAAIFRLLPTEAEAARLADHIRNSAVGKVWVTRLHRRPE